MDSDLSEYYTEFIKEAVKTASNLKQELNEKTKLELKYLNAISYLLGFVPKWLEQDRFIAPGVYEELKKIRTLLAKK